MRADLVETGEAIEHGTGVARIFLVPEDDEEETAAAAREASLLGQALRPLRERIGLRHILLVWAVCASLLAAVLFVERRQPPVPAAIPASPAILRQPADLAPPLPPGLAGAPPQLVGIVGRLPDDAVALVRMPSGRTRTLAVGSVFDGWTLASLDADEAVFARRGQRVTVTLPPAEPQ